jgi:hypothetical protein
MESSGNLQKTTSSPICILKILNRSRSKWKVLKNWRREIFGKLWVFWRMKILFQSKMNCKCFVQFYNKQCCKCFHFIFNCCDNFFRFKRVSRPYYCFQPRKLSNWSLNRNCVKYSRAKMSSKHFLRFYLIFIHFEVSS